MSFPDYNRTNWENNVTDADENTMNNIEDGIEDNRGYIQTVDTRSTQNQETINSLSFNMESGSYDVEGESSNTTNVNFSNSYDYVVLSLGFDAGFTSDLNTRALYRNDWTKEGDKYTGCAISSNFSAGGTSADRTIYWEILGVNFE